MRKLFGFLFWACSLCGFESDLKERIEKGVPGDYIVSEANQLVTLIAIRSITPSAVLLEEISAPVRNFDNYPPSWPEWVKNRAPGHTSWSMVEIDFKNGQVLESYSFSRSAWIQLSEKESLFATLLQLPLEKVSKEAQRKIGPPPLAGEMDIRKLWVPPVRFEGEKKEKIQFDVYETKWPSDGSELSGQRLLLYFDQDRISPFPFWIQVETSHAAAALKTIDSGKNLPLIHKTIPRRVPEFVGSPLKTDQRLRLNLKSPKYYRQFELYAIDITEKKKQIFPISHSLIEGPGESKTVEIDLKELNQVLEKDHRYTWLLVPIGHTESYTETSKPFTWIPSSPKD